MNTESWKHRIGVEMNDVSFKEKLISAAGGVLAILLLVFLTRLCLHGIAGAFVMASMGASAVLIFAVPHGQLSQPWPVLALSTIAGILPLWPALFVHASSPRQTWPLRVRWGWPLASCMCASASTRPAVPRRSRP